jgi:quercetin dioxygenase-like cupin family protein
MSGTAKSTVFIDNERIIVTEYRFQKGNSTGWHRHAHDYVIMPMTNGSLKIVTKDGESIAEMKKGAPYFRREASSTTLSTPLMANTSSSKSS